jgi:peptide chain release factor
MRHEMWLQISAGSGPAECALAVVQVLQQLLAEAAAGGFEARTLEMEPGPQPGTANSVLVSISGGDGLAEFAATWCGTVQWQARSPFRPEHKRKNWFVGIEQLDPVAETAFRPSDVRWETMRASGPGGQHVNRTESAVRVTHVPSGLQAVASEERSQHRNRKLALARLAARLADRDAQHRGESQERRWRAHHDLQRGNPVRTVIAR